MTSSRTRLLPGSTAAWIAALSGTALLGAGVAHPSGRSAGILVLALAAALAAALLRAVPWSARPVDQESAVRTRLALGATVLGAGALGTAACAVVPAWRVAGSLPIAVAAAVAFLPVYSGLLRWNRYSTRLADPSELLNGASSVAAAVAVANLVVDLIGGGFAALPDWRLQPLLTAAAASVVYLGTSWVMAVIAALRRDPRIWLVTTALTAVTTAAVLALADHGRTGIGAPLGLVALAAGLLAVSGAVRPQQGTPVPADPAGSTIGAYFIVVVAVLVLAAEALLHPTWMTTVCAGAAALGSSMKLLANVHDLALLAVAREEALTDDLTEVANRRAVVRRIEELCGSGQPFVLALADVDNFKEVNDGLGHTGGDELLRQVARIMRTELDPAGLLGRLGGDQFAAVLPVRPGTALPEAAAALGANLHRWASRSYEVSGLRLHVEMSVGAAVHGHPETVAGTCSTLLLSHADVAMHDAKRSRSGSVVWRADRHADTSGRLALVQELRTALAHGQLVLHHQPQIDISTGRVVGVEALVRWQHPTRGLLGPGEFLPVAELHGLMRPLTEVVVEQAVSQAARWREAGLDVRVSVNLSASNLLDAGLPGRIAELLAQHRVPASTMVFEVTETVLISDPELSGAVLRALADLGAGVSIDDFGTGFASLAYLRELPASELKLDRSFTVDLLTDERTAAIVSSTIGLAHHLGLRVVAEGVEQVDTLARLAALGCDESQGYLHSRPLPADQVTRLLAPNAPVPPLAAMS